MTSPGWAPPWRANDPWAPGIHLAIGSLVVASAVLLLVGAGQPVVAFVPLATVLGALLFFVLPLRALVFGVASLALIVDPPSGRAADGKWSSPLAPVGRLLFENLNTITGISSLRFSLIELLLVLLIGKLLLGRAARDRDRAFDTTVAAGSLTPTGVMCCALALWFGTILWLELFGLARGGDLRNSLWQARALFWLPVVAWLFSAVMRGLRDFVWMARAIIVAASIKVAFGLYFLIAIARPQALVTAYVMTHDDTFLLVTAALLCLAAWVYRPSRGHLLLLCSVAPWMLVGIVINDRRIAYVSMVGCLLVVYAHLDRRRKRLATLAALVTAPLFAVYLLVGQHRGGRLYAPAAKIMSVLRQTDASSSTRDIENYNLYVTLRAKGRLLGSGFGHEYVESVAAYDISGNFAQYRYIAHNSVLWLWSIGGLLGITMLWTALVVGVYFAARSFRMARSPIERTAAVTVISVVLIYLVQSWGDMGTQSWLGMLLLAAMLATAGRLAAATGAWPDGVTLFRRDDPAAASERPRR